MGGEGGGNLFGGFEHGDGVVDALAEGLCVAVAVLVAQLGGERLEVFDGAGYAPPVNVLQRGVALSVDAEGCVVLALYQPVSPLVAVLAPHLYRQRDVRIELVLGRS